MTFNLKKSQIGYQTYVDPMNDLNFVAAADKVLAMHPEFGTIQDFMSAPPLGLEDISNPDAVIAYSESLQSDILEDAASDVKNTEMAVNELKEMSKKPFNLKEAQGMDSQPLDVQPQQGIESTKTYETHSDLNNMLVESSSASNFFNTSWNNILAENPKEADSAQSALKSYFQGFGMKSKEKREKEAEIIYDFIYGKEDIMPIDAEFKELGASVNETSNIIKKLAQKSVSRDKKKAYNLTKTAQHKTLDNAILYGPGETRIDPFLHQPVSDWHIVERNKGFGLVVDDIWNIDYETIWRENVMDKYSRPYKNKEGKWVGGYLNKRFEIDSNVPETSNMQLKPGQLRRPILPEYGNTESRLQAARAKGDIAGAIDTSKPFNWKEASKKKS
jgi:hypothetical protein